MARRPIVGLRVDQPDLLLKTIPWRLGAREKGISIMLFIFIFLSLFFVYAVIRVVIAVFSLVFNVIMFFGLTAILVFIVSVYLVSN